MTKHTREQEEAMKITLKGKYGRGKVALIDDRFAPAVNAYKWQCTPGGYAFTRLPTGARPGLTVYLHTFVQVLADIIPEQSDHVNRDRLDCRLENLRPATQSQNNRNQMKRAGTTSRYRGVSRRHVHGGWQAQIRVNRQVTRLGVYTSEEEAALAYNRAARALPELEFIPLNDLPDDGHALARRKRDATQRRKQ